MLLDDEYVLEQVEVPTREVDIDPDGGVHLEYNDTDPLLERDGIDDVVVIRECEDSYRIEYAGFTAGRIRTTREGVERLGADLLGADGPVPSWTLDPASVDPEDLPPWVPEDVVLEPSVECDRCGAEVDAREALVPGPTTPEDSPQVYCPDCWERGREDR